MTILSLSLVVLCSLLLGYTTFIISPVHGREELNNELLKQSEMDTKLNRAEIQSLKDVLALMMAASNGDDLAKVMGKRNRGKRPKQTPSPPPSSNAPVPHNGNAGEHSGLCKCSKCMEGNRPEGSPSNPAPPKGNPSNPAPPKGNPGNSAPPKGNPGNSAPPKGNPGNSAPPKGNPGNSAPPKGNPSNPGSSSGEKLQCENKNPLQGYTSRVPPQLQKDVERYKNFNPYCGKNRGLHLLDIMKMANSITGKNIFPIQARHSYSYLPPSRNCRAKVFESGQQRCKNGFSCERNFRDSEMYLLDDCPNVEEYWSGWTPCYFCQRSLLDWKRDTDRKLGEAPVTIHVGEVYNWGDKQSTPECLALMIRNGFNFIAWDWNVFEQKMMFGQMEVDNDCRRLIKFLQMCAETDAARKSMKSGLAHANNLAKMHNTTELHKLCYGENGRMFAKINWLP